MTITRVLAQATVTDLDASQQWYARLFGRSPDARPMARLLEWHLSDTFGIQVWAEPDRAGKSCVVLEESDLDAFVAHLDQAGIGHPGPQDASTSRILPLEDPDGNRVVFTGAFASPAR
jgi:catechol 2,3-dioxygenase-like lactoylglutathione lyase family enzyme